MALDYLDRWSTEGLLLDSAAEAELAAILESGPGTDARAVLAKASGWLVALRAVATEPDALARRRLIIFPQVGLLRFCADFMAVCADVRDVGKAPSLSRFAFFVERDGVVDHARTRKHVPRIAQVAGATHHPYEGYSIPWATQQSGRPVFGTRCAPSLVIKPWTTLRSRHGATWVKRVT